MKAAVGVELGGHLGGVDGVHEVVGRERDALEAEVVEARDRLTRRTALDQRSQRVDLLQIGDLERGDEIPAARQVCDLPLLLEDAQRLTDRCDADAELAGELVLADACSRPQLARDDRAPQAIQRVLGGGAGAGCGAHPSGHSGPPAGR